MAKGISLPVTQSGLEASIQQGVKNVGKINIPVNLDPTAFKNLAQPLGRVSGLATEFEKSIAASNARVLAFGASVGIINGVQNAFADLVRTGIDVQKTLADIAAISGKGGQELSKFGDALFDTAKNTSQSFKTAAQAALEFSRQGLSTEETLKRTNDALTLTRFTTLSAAEAVDVLTAAANSFSDTGITTAQIINKLVAVDTKFAVSAEDLANGLARAGSIAQEVGVSFDELNAAVTVTQERTARGGAVIGNALKTIFARLRSDETVKALRSIGVETLNAQGGLKDAIPLLQEVANKIQGLSGGERVQILEAVASKYNINILSALLDDLNNANSKFGQAVAISATASTQAYERQVELNKTLAAQINSTTVSVTQLFNKLAEIGVTDNLNSLLKFVNDLLSGFNKLLNSEGTGANIAKGIIKGLSDVFFSVGLPIIGAIFVKLTTDIAKFGVESLKTILGINQQVRERQALEQAVVNTLIKDQQVMQTILALSGNRAKQEEYLLGVYNRQLAALQQVQNIATSVAPALMVGGLSATSGQVRKRGAGGYLPAQEAADVRRGIGGASPSSKVVSIPNFAFGGGKRGTMIANTSEYIVPNFANGGSAIFNQDMAKAYGLPSGARKISAAGGYIPNFADAKKAYVKEGDVPYGYQQVYTSLGQGFRKGSISDEANLLSKGYRLMTPSELSSYNASRASRKEASSIGKAAMLIPSGIDNPLAYAEPQDPENKVYSKVTFPIYGLKPSELPKGGQVPAYKQQVEKNVEEMGKGFTAELINSVSIDDNIYKQAWKASYGAQSTISSLAGGLFEAGVRYLTHPEGTMAKDNSNTLDFPNLSSQSGQVVKKIFRVKGERAADLKGSDSGSIQRKFASQVLKNGLAAAFGYVPNFAGGGPLEDAIGREMAAGINPSQIRVTQDGRLRNSQNPSGLAVINTRDEPNGKIPNFATPPPGALDPVTGKKIGNRFVSARTIYESPIGPQLPQPAAKDPAETTNKLLLAFSGLQIASSTLQSAFKDTESGVASFATKLTSTLAGISSGALLGSVGKDLIGNRGGAGMFGAFLRGTGKALPFIGAAVGGITAVMDQKEQEAANRKNLEDQKNSSEFARRAQSLRAKAIDDEAFLNSLKNEQAQYEAQSAKVAQEKAKLNKDLAADELNLINLNSLDKRTPQESKTILDLRTKITEQRQRSNELQTESNKLTGDAKRNAELIRNQEDLIKNSKFEAANAEKRLTAELTAKIPIQAKINELQLAFARGRANDEIKAAKAAADNLLRAEEFSEFAKITAVYENRRAEIQNKINSLGGEAVENLTAELASKFSISAASQDELQILIEQARVSGNIGDFQERFIKLGVTNIKVAEDLVQSSNNKVEKDKLALQTQLQSLAINEKLEKSLKIQNEAYEARRKSILDAIDDEQELQDIAEKGFRELEDLRQRTPLIQLQNKIARQPFASREDEYNLALLNARIQEYTEKQKIADAVTRDVQSNFQKLRKTFVSTAQGLQKTEGFDPIELSEAFAQSKGVEGLISQLEKLESEIKKSEQAFLDLSEKSDLGLAADNEAANERNRLEKLRQGYSSLQVELAKYNISQEDAKLIGEELTRQMSEFYGFQSKMLKLRKESPFSAGMLTGMYEIRKEADDFSFKMGNEIPLLFRDGLRDAMSAAISQTDDLGSALQNVATGFLKTLQNAFLQNASNNILLGLQSSFPTVFPKGMAKGGLVSGGSGYRDDVPTMLTGGEFVMRKSAVQKYGQDNLAKLNAGKMPTMADGGFFLPGFRGQESISGIENLKKFSEQTTTSGATDVMKGGPSSAFINLEDQSMRLSRFALLGDDTINQEIRDAQQSALEAIEKRRQYDLQKEQQKKEFKKQIISTVASAALSYGTSAFLSGATKTATASGLGLLNQAAGKTQFLAGAENSSFLNWRPPGRAYGGMIQRYASGGGVKDDIPALLMGGEYVMSRQATKKYGKQFFDSINQGRAPRFANGGEVGGSEMLGEKFDNLSSKLETRGAPEVNITVNVTSSGGSETKAQGESSQGGIDYKKMSERIKAVVIETINEEKRLGGSLRNR